VGFDDEMHGLMDEGGVNSILRGFDESRSRGFEESKESHERKEEICLNRLLKKEKIIKFALN